MFKPLKEKTFKESPKESSVCAESANLVTELLNAAVSFHKLHLKITGIGSFAAHKATNEAYDALPSHADDIAEEVQGAFEELLKYNEKAPKVLSTVKEGIAYANELKTLITSLQTKMPHSEIVNILDETKSTLNSLKYKLLFLQ